MSFRDGSTYEMTEEELATDFANDLGFSGERLGTALRVAYGESRFTANAFNDNEKKGDFSLGLFQINFFKNLAPRAKSLGWTSSDNQNDQQIAALAAFNYKPRNKAKARKDESYLADRNNIVEITKGQAGYVSPDELFQNNIDAFNLVYLEDSPTPWRPWSVHPDSAQFKEDVENRGGNLEEAIAEFNNDVSGYVSRYSQQNYNNLSNPAFDGMTPTTPLDQRNTTDINDPGNPAFDGMIPDPSFLEDTVSGGFGSFEFLKNRDDANIVINGQEINFAVWLEKQIKENINDAKNNDGTLFTADEITLLIDRYLPRTEWFQNTAPIRRATQAEWSNQGLGQNWETLTPARLGLIEEKFQIVADLIGREGITQTTPSDGQPTAVQEIATLAYFYDWDDKEISKYIAGQTIDGQKGSDLLTAGSSQPGSQIRQIKTALRGLGSEYLVGLGENEENALAKRVYTGELPSDNLRTIFEEKARLQYTYLADFYDAGGTTNDFLSNYNPIMQRLLGRNAEWGGRDFALAQSILLGQRNTKGFNDVLYETLPLEDQPDFFVNSETNNMPGMTFEAPEDMQRVLNVGEVERAVRRTGEFDGSGFARAEMSSMLNAAGQGMGFF